MTTEVSIDRTSLSLSPLVIGSQYADAGMWLAPDGLGRPGMAWSRSYATARDWHGAVQTDARLEQSSIALTVYLSGSSTANLETRYNTLQAALFQFAFAVDVTVDSATRTWLADCADVQPGNYLPELASNYLQLVAVSIPVFPIQS